MRDFRRYRPLQLLRRRLFTLVLLAVIILLANGVWGVFQKERQTRENRIEAEAQGLELAHRERELRTELARLKSSYGVEEQLREQFEVARDGERLIIIIEEPVPENTEDETTFWRQWTEFLWKF